MTLYVNVQPPLWKEFTYFYKVNVMIMAFYKKTQHDYYAIPMFVEYSELKKY
jgi:hypothetical protein